MTNRNKTYKQKNSKKNEKLTEFSEYGVLIHITPDGPLLKNMLSLDGGFFSGGCMKYMKRPLTFDEQVQQLMDRGLQGDPNIMRDRLQSVNYYRLSGYLYPYRDGKSDNFTKLQTRR